MKDVTDKQLGYLKKNGLFHDKKMSRRHAWLCIEANEQKKKSANIKTNILNHENYDLAGLKIKRFLTARGIEFKSDILRRDAVEIIERLGYSIDSDDVIEKDEE